MATGQLPRIEAQTRDRVGSRYAARLRKEGRLPAVVYGHGQDPAHLTVDRKTLVDLLHDHAHLIEVTLDGNTEPCLVKDVQWDAFGREIIHIDLTRVDLTEEVEVEVDLQIVGEPAALNTPGAILDHPESAITVACTANNIPEVIRVDIGELGIGDVITVADLTLPEGVTAVTEPETVIARIDVVEATDEDETPEEGASAEPEVVGRGAKEEDEDEG